MADFTIFGAVLLRGYRLVDCGERDYGHGGPSSFAYVGSSI